MTTRDRAAPERSNGGEHRHSAAPASAALAEARERRPAEAARLAALCAESGSRLEESQAGIFFLGRPELGQDPPVARGLVAKAPPRMPGQQQQQLRPRWAAARGGRGGRGGSGAA